MLRDDIAADGSGMDAIPIRNTCPSPEPPLSQCSRRPGVNDFKFRATQRNYMDDASVGQNGCVGIIKQTDWPAWRIRGQALKRHGGEKMSEETLKFPRHGRRGGVDRASRK